MKIICDNQETATIIRQLCDLGLKSGGLQNLNAIVAVLNSIVVQQAIKPELSTPLEGELSKTRLPAAIVDRQLRKIKNDKKSEVDTGNPEV